MLAEVYIYIFAFSFLSYVFSGIYCLISINNKIVLRHLFYKMWLVFLKFTLLPFGVGLAELTNISHDAVCLFSNNSQMKSKSGKNKTLAHEAQPDVQQVFVQQFFHNLLFYRPGTPT